jgi:hypothetical protein
MGELTRDNNTNNFSEASIRVLKDIILNRTKAFNVVALVIFCIDVWDPYFVSRLSVSATVGDKEVSVNIWLGFTKI